MGFHPWRYPKMDALWWKQPVKWSKWMKVSPIYRNPMNPLFPMFPCENPMKPYSMGIPGSLNRVLEVLCHLRPYFGGYILLHSLYIGLKNMVGTPPICWLLKWPGKPVEPRDFRHLFPACGFLCSAEIQELRPHPQGSHAGVVGSPYRWIPGQKGRSLGRRKNEEKMMIEWDMSCG